MALTLNEFIGFETGGLEEANATSGTPDATETTIVRSGARSLAMNATADQYDLDPLKHVTSGGTGNVLGFALYPTDKTPASDTTIIIIGDSTDADILNLVLDADGDIVVNDNTGATTINDPLTENSWNYIELFWNHVDSGSWELFVNGISVGSGSSRDMSGGGTLNLCRFQGTATGTFYYDDIYWLSGATAASDRFGDAEVFKYQSAKAGATPDTSALADDDLNLGAWVEAGKTPLESAGTDAEYTDAGAGVVYTNATNGSPQGPNGDARIDGDSNIKGMKGISNMLRSGGGGTDHFIHMGNDGGAASDLLKSADLDPTTAFVNYFLLTESTTVMPTASEHCAIGFETTDGQDYQCQEQWAMLLHVPTVPALTALSQADFPDQNYYIGPFEI